MKEMKKKFFLRTWFLVTSATIFVFLVIISGICIWFYGSVFRVSRSQVMQELSSKKSLCETLNTCSILPGDILIRKYMTQRIQYIDKPLNIFFTHAAFYLGDGKLFEVFGPEKNSNDDIQILELSKSDWLNSDITNFMIIRPKKYSETLETIKKTLTYIANDSNYRFGLPFLGPQRVTCADVIFDQLNKNGVVHVQDIPRIVTPDYLFWLAIHSPNDFEIVGFHVQ